MKMEKFNTLTEVRERRELLRKDIFACEDQILENVTRPLRFLGGTPTGNLQKIKQIVGFASTAVSVYSAINGLRKRKR